VNLLVTVILRSGRLAIGEADKGVTSSLQEMSAPFSEAGKKRITFSLFSKSAGLVNSVERSGTAIKQSSGKSGLILAY